MKKKTKLKDRTSAKIKQLRGVKAEKVTEDQLKRVQESVNGINRAQLEIGSMEVQKHELMHRVAGLRESLGMYQINGLIIGGRAFAEFSQHPAGGPERWSVLVKGPAEPKPGKKNLMME